MEYELAGQPGTPTALGQVLPEWSPPQPAIQHLWADAQLMSDMSTRLGGGGATGSVWSGGGCGTWSDGFGMERNGWRVAYQTRMSSFTWFPRDEVSFVPGDR